MDVVSGESSGNFGQLWLLYPLLFWLQALQANIGVSMMLRGYGALFSPEGWLVGSRQGPSLCLPSCMHDRSSAPILGGRKSKGLCLPARIGRASCSSADAVTYCRHAAPFMIAGQY